MVYFTRNATKIKYATAYTVNTNTRIQRATRNTSAQNRSTDKQREKERRERERLKECKTMKKIKKKEEN